MMQRIFNIICIVAFSSAAFAQKNTGGDLAPIAGALRDDNKALLRKAIEGPLCLVRACYNLRYDSTGVLYAKKNQQFFAVRYYVGVKMDAHVVLPALAATPWKLDDSLTEYKSGYTPVLMRMEYRSLSDTFFQKMDTSQLKYAVTAGLVNYTATDTADQMKSSAEPIQEGDYIIWLAVDKSRIADSFVNPMFFYNKVPSAKDKGKGAATIKEPFTDNYLAGGIALETRITAGMIRFMVKGLIFKKADGWTALGFTERSVQPIGTDELQAVSPSNQLPPDNTKDKKGKKKRINK